MSVTTTLFAWEGPPFDAVSVNDAVSPALADGVFATLISERSALVVTTPAADASLFVVSGSGVADVPLTELLIVAESVALGSRSKTTTKSLLVPGEIVPALHVTVPASEQLGSDAAATNVLDGSNVSVRETPFASEGPLLVAVSVHETWDPATTGVVLRDLEIAMSADGAVVAVADARLSAATGSSSVAETAALLSIEPVAVGSINVPMVIVLEAPAATEPTAHVTTPGEVSLQEGSEVAGSKLRSAPRLSVMTTLDASDGPALVVVRSQVVVSPGTAEGPL